MTADLEALKKENAKLKGELVAQRREMLQHRMLASVFNSSTQPIALVNANFQILSVNPAFETLSGYSKDDIQFFPINGLIAHYKRQELWPPVQTSLEQEGHWEGILWNETKFGHVYRVETRIMSLDAHEVDTAKYVIFCRDVTKEQEIEEELQHQRNYDLITDLPNWNLFLNHFINALYLSGQDQSQTALLFIGLDGFKTINDTLGYTIGDKLLQRVAVRFDNILPEETTLARFSGDQFTAVIPKVHNEDEVRHLAEAVMGSLEKPFQIENEEIVISCSIGICQWPGDGDDVETLLRNADSAMHKAKDLGRNTFHFFTPDIDARAQARRAIESDLRNAIKDFSEFHLVYQPIVDLRTGEMKSAEALIRWHSRERGLVSPDQFIPLAEQNGMILNIGRWVLETACREIREWSKTSSSPFRVSVNLSSRQFKEANLSLMVKEALAKSGFDANQLCLEITETLMMENIEDAILILKDLKAMGVRLSIDDFGTGYSSLNYLKRLPLDALKIDRTFVRDVMTNEEDAAMVKAILTMAQSLRLEVVGEGIESDDHNQFLKSIGCELGQGYYFSRPLRIEEFNNFAASHEKRFSA